MIRQIKVGSYAINSSSQLSISCVIENENNIFKDIVFITMLPKSEKGGYDKNKAIRMKINAMELLTIAIAIEDILNPHINTFIYEKINNPKLSLHAQNNFQNIKKIEIKLGKIENTYYFNMHQSIYIGILFKRSSLKACAEIMKKLANKLLDELFIFRSEIKNER